MRKWASWRPAARVAPGSAGGATKAAPGSAVAVWASAAEAVAVWASAAGGDERGGGDSSTVCARAAPAGSTVAV
jgi:hypothetical protein